MIAVKKVTFLEAMKFIAPLLRQAGILAIPYSVNKNKWEITIKIPKFIPYSGQITKEVSQ